MATMEKLEGSKVKLTIEVSAEQFEAATQKAYQKAGKRFNVPGFRKGKAPRKVIENMYGPLAFLTTPSISCIPRLTRLPLRNRA